MIIMHEKGRGEMVNMSAIGAELISEKKAEAGVIVGASPEVVENLEAKIKELEEMLKLQASTPTGGNEIEGSEELVIQLKELSSFEDKDALEVYGKEIGIDLKKNKSLENMYKDLEAFISK